MAEFSERIGGRKERLAILHNAYPEREPEERVRDFQEVVIGYDEETARREAARCMQCPQPSSCVLACPLHNDIPAALWLIAQGDFLGAAEVYRKTSIIPEICGRVCPQERLCEGACTLGKQFDSPSLGKLEMFVADYQRRTEGWPRFTPDPPTGKRVAIVGSGPAGLAVAESLALKGHAVTVFEAAPYPGGLLLYGIPNFKLPKALIMDKVEYLKHLGADFVCNTRIGRDRTIDDLFNEGFHAIFVGVGANVDAKLKAPGVELAGIYQSGEFLMRASPPSEAVPAGLSALPEVGRRVAVIGGGDTATDCLRTALRLGAEDVVCYYRRTEAEMPGSRRERQHALEEGVRIEYLVAPVRFFGDEKGHVRSMELQRMQLGDKDKSGRPRPVPIAGSEFVVPVDTVLLALGYWPDEMIGKTTPDLKTHDWGLIDANKKTGETSRAGVYAGGDDVTGPDLVSTAIAAGLNAAAAMHEYLSR